jgi:hypothetical protein
MWIPTIVGIFHFWRILNQAEGLDEEFEQNVKDAAKRSLHDFVI